VRLLVDWKGARAQGEGAQDLPFALLFAGACRPMSVPPIPPADRSELRRRPCESRLMMTSLRSTWLQRLEGTRIAGDVEP
jgi:hypothetical protein